MSDIPLVSQPSDGAVRIDLSSAEAAEKSLQDVGQLQGEILFYRKGTDFFAVEQGKGPSFWESNTPSCWDADARHYANDQVGAKLAELFPEGPGASLQKQMNSGWFKQPVDSSAFKAALDQHVRDRTNELCDDYHRQRFPPGGQAKISQNVFSAGVGQANQVLRQYAKEEVSYSEAIARLHKLSVPRTRKLHPPNLETEEVKEVQRAGLLNEIVLDKNVGYCLRARYTEVYTPARLTLKTARVINRCTERLEYLKAYATTAGHKQAVNDLDARFRIARKATVNYSRLEAIDREVQSLYQEVQGGRAASE